MDKDIILQAERINKLLKNNATIKQYQALREDILNKYELDEQELIAMQQDLVNATQATPEIFLEKKEAYLEKKNRLTSSPLMKEYLRVYQEYQALIMNIKAQLEK